MTAPMDKIDEILENTISATCIFFGGSYDYLEPEEQEELKQVAKNALKQLISEAEIKAYRNGYNKGYNAEVKKGVSDE